MLEIARHKHNAKFIKCGFDEVSFKPAEFVVASGVFQFQDHSNPTYYKLLVKHLFSKARIALAVNFLSSTRQDSEKALTNLYLQPCEVVELAASLSPDVGIYYSYHIGFGDVTMALFHTDKNRIWKRPTSIKPRGRSSMYEIERKIEAVVRTRRATTNALLSALQMFSKEGFSEKQLADKWMEKIKQTYNLCNCGWYLPPPYGMSVLIGNEPDYNRLRYNSLREVENWPSSQILYSNNSILYPYFSAVDKETLLIGDFVGTFYKGRDPAIRNWINTAYKLTLEIAKFVQSGQQVSDIYNFAQDKISSLGVLNNTYSQSGGLASDIGHSIPGISQDSANLDLISSDLTDKEVASKIAGARSFISKENNSVLGSSFGLTIEPQLIASELPMASFHVIVLFANEKKTIVTEFDSLFEYFGMLELMSSE